MYGCGEQEAGVASGSGWNLWVWLLGAVVRRYVIHATFQSNCAEGLHFSAFHYNCSSLLKLIISIISYNYYCYYENITLVKHLTTLLEKYGDWCGPVTH